VNIRASPVVVRCLTCAAAVDASSSQTCPFCGTDLASMPVIEPEPAFEEVEPIAATPEVTALAIIPKPRRRRRRWPLVLLVVAAVAAAFIGKDLRQSAERQTPARMPSVAIPIVTQQPPVTPAPTLSPSPSPAAEESHAVSAPSAPQGCGSFTTQEIDREYAFARGRADLAYQRAQQINQHYYNDDGDKAGYDAREKAAADEHAAAIAQLNRDVVRARDACDASLLN
jgi:hypothetical protein